MELPSSLEARGVHHVGLAVADLDAALATWLGPLGGTLLVRAEIEEQGVEAAAVALETGEIELIAPLKSRPDGGPVASFIAQRGAGLHHVAFGVDDTALALARARELNLRLIDETPRIGLHGVPIAFLHPSSFGGVLVELVQVSSHA